MTIYNVIHHYDVDGGFGDAIHETETLFSFESKADAEAFVAKYAFPHVWDKPYDELKCGELTIEEQEIIPVGTEVEFDVKDFSPWGCVNDLYWREKEDDE